MAFSVGCPHCFFYVVRIWSQPRSPHVVPLSAIRPRLEGFAGLVRFVGLMGFVRFVDFPSLVGTREPSILAKAATGLGKDRRGHASESKRMATVSFGGQNKKNRTLCFFLSIFITGCQSSCACAVWRNHVFYLFAL